jgi:hypothetical protein
MKTYNSTTCGAMRESERGQWYAKDEADAVILELEAENLHTENLYAREIERRKDAEAERDAARADAERYWEACNYALAAHYGRLSPMHNHWAAVIEKAMAQDTKGDAARRTE